MPRLPRTLRLPRALAISSAVLVSALWTAPPAAHATGADIPTLAAEILGSFSVCHANRHNGHRRKRLVLPD